MDMIVSKFKKLGLPNEMISQKKANMQVKISNNLSPQSSQTG